MTTQPVQYDDGNTCVVAWPEECDRLEPWPAHSREIRVRRKPCGQSAAGSDLRTTFTELATSWRNQTWYVSSIQKRISHPDYLKIIGLGAKAVPWILEELKNEPDYWFAALEAITREDPAPNASSVAELRDAWLAWGEKLAR